MIWKADLHVHTCFSRDSLTRLPDLIRVARARGLSKVAVTDHNTIEGALRARDLAPDLIIVGQEIDTTMGELIAYFLEEPIPRGLAPLEAITLLKDQGAVVGVSHPFESLRSSALARGSLVEIIDEVEALEVFNSRCLRQRDNRRAREWAHRHGKLQTAGSDAHTLWEVGRGYVAMPPFEGADGFRGSLASAEVHGRPSGLLIHIPSTSARILRRFGWP